MKILREPAIEEELDVRLEGISCQIDSSNDLNIHGSLVKNSNAARHISVIAELLDSAGIVLATAEDFSAKNVLSSRCAFSLFKSERYFDPSLLDAVRIYPVLLAE